MDSNEDINHPDAPDSIPPDVVDFIRDADMYTLDELAAHLDREMTVRASEVLETRADELPAKYLRHR